MNKAYIISMCVMQSRQSLEEIVKEMALICNLQEVAWATEGDPISKRKGEEMERRGQRHRRGDARSKKLDRETEANSKQQQDDMTKSCDS